MAACPSCGAANPAGKRFCGDCGSALAFTCPNCGAENPPDKRFCGDCGAGLGEKVAVRAALDLVAAVQALGQEVGAEGLRARAGVLTGEAAVNLAAVGEGMVAGDLVNTASRVQSVAEPGSVLVGESTRRATEGTVVYEPAGSFALKGKEGETPLWRALRVVSGRGGSLKSEGLEAPFVGRDRELRQIKDLFHVVAEEGRAQLVSVTGIAGIGKSRLAWEFYKYFDGIAQT